MVARLLQPQKALTPRVVREAEREMVARLVQPRKAPSPREVHDSGSITSIRLVHQEKAPALQPPSAIPTTPSGSTILVTLASSLNALLARIPSAPTFPAVHSSSIVWVGISGGVAPPPPPSNGFAGSWPVRTVNCGYEQRERERERERERGRQNV
jgi:hypothetical protein